jgi:DNA-binding GntR family transcriptional regulator
MALIETQDTGNLRRTPLHEQVREALLARIAAGVWRGREGLPNEGQLPIEFGVSQGTIRRALDALEAEGVLERRQGRGTFVRELVAWDELSTDAKHFLFVIAAERPADDPAVTAVETAAGTRSVTYIRNLERGAAEVAAWLERRARIGDRASLPHP